MGETDGILNEAEQVKLNPFPSVRFLWKTPGDPRITLEPDALEAPTLPPVVPVPLSQGFSPSQTRHCILV